MNLTRDLLDFKIGYYGSGYSSNFEDNPYYTFKLHRYTNIRDFNESLPVTSKPQDIEIPLVPCNEKFENDGNWDLSATNFCPDYRKTDILSGSYYT